MATSTEQITDLISGYTDLKSYFEGAQSDIETQLAAAIAAFPALAKTLYVDADNGDDTAVGTAAAPMATLEAAVDRVPSGGSGRIILLTDVTLSAKRNSIVNKLITVIGSSAPSGRAAVNLTAFESGGSVSISGWDVSPAGGMMMRFCTLNFPEYTGDLDEHVRYASMIGQIEGIERILVQFGSSECDFNFPANNGAGTICTLNTVVLHFLISGITDVNSNMSGRYIRNASTTDPQSEKTLITNMTTL